MIALQFHNKNKKKIRKEDRKKHRSLGRLLCLTHGNDTFFALRIVDRMHLARRKFLYKYMIRINGVIVIPAILPRSHKPRTIIYRCQMQSAFFSVDVCTCKCSEYACHKMNSISIRTGDDE